MPADTYPHDATTQAAPRGLKIFALLFGLGIAGTALGSLMGLSSPTYAPLGLPPAIILDNNMRFYGGIWLVLGLALVWVAPRLHVERALFRAVFVAIFAGGIGRVLSMLFAGMPPPAFVAYAGIELIGAPLVIWWHHRALQRSHPSGPAARA